MIQQSLPRPRAFRCRDRSSRPRAHRDSTDNYIALLLGLAITISHGGMRRARVIIRMRGTTVTKRCISLLPRRIQCPAFAHGRIHELYLRKLRNPRRHWAADRAARRSGSLHRLQRRRSLFRRNSEVPAFLHSRGEPVRRCLSGGAGRPLGAKCQARRRAVQGRRNFALLRLGQRPMGSRRTELFGLFPLWSDPRSRSGQANSGCARGCCRPSLPASSSTTPRAPPPKPPCSRSITRGPAAGFCRTIWAAAEWPLPSVARPAAPRNCWISHPPKMARRSKPGPSSSCAGRPVTACGNATIRFTCWVPARIWI